MNYLQNHQSTLAQINTVLKDGLTFKDGFTVLNAYSEIADKIRWHHFYDLPLAKHEKIHLIHTNRILSPQNQSLDNLKQTMLNILSDDFTQALTAENLAWFNQHLNPSNMTQEERIDFIGNICLAASIAIPLTFNYVSLMVHGYDINELLVIGSNKALLNAVRVDKSLLAHPTLINRLQKAQLEGDDLFFHGLSSEIRKPNFLSKAKYPRTYIAYSIWERDGLLKNGKINPEYGYTYSNLLEALHEAGFFEGHGEGITEPKKLNTHIQTYFKLRTRNPF